MLGYHDCDQDVGERLLPRPAFKPSANDYDWLGPGIYFWEANPQRAHEFAEEVAAREESGIRKPFAIGAIIEMGLCLDLTTSTGVDRLRIAHQNLFDITQAAGSQFPVNSRNHLRQNLDCAVMQRLHAILEERNLPAFDTLKGVFFEGAPVYPGSGFRDKTHFQIAVRNPDCIKGVFRVPLK